MDDTKRLHILLLAAVDMDHTKAAVSAIQREHQSTRPDVNLLRALETAVVVSYWRPFSTSNSIGSLDESDVTCLDQGWLTLHTDLKRRRDKVYAHTDKVGGRVPDIRDMVLNDEDVAVIFTEEWEPLPPESLPDIYALADAQAARCRAEAIEVARLLKRLIDR